MQMNAGFEPRGLVANYLNDPVCDNYSVLIVLDADRRVVGWNVWMEAASGIAR